MDGRLKWFFAMLVCGVLLALTGCHGDPSGMLNPKGYIAHEERKLFFDTLALMLIVVLPVIIMSFAFVYHYRASHRTRDYKPNWSHSYFLEALWWGIPCAIIFALAWLTWNKTHELDPYKRIAGYNEPPLQIQVIALPWKWLFIYPEQGIATVDYLTIPAGRQVEFFITADNVPMSAFFVPQLGSQIYAMAGMRTRLHLIADAIGEMDGENTQYNGDGFSEMHFKVYVVAPNLMQDWVDQIKKSPNELNDQTYAKLLTPTIGAPPVFFGSIKPGLFQQVITLYVNSTGEFHPRANLK